jgi:hypothetical protein
LEDVSNESETVKHDNVPVSSHLKEDNSSSGGSATQSSVHNAMPEPRWESHSDAAAMEDEHGALTDEGAGSSRGSALENASRNSALETVPSELKDCDATRGINERHSDDVIDNKMEHSCTFIVEQLHGHNGIVRAVSLVDDYLVTGR